MATLDDYFVFNNVRLLLRRPALCDMIFTHRGCKSKVVSVVRMFRNVLIGLRETDKGLVVSPEEDVHT